MKITDPVTFIAAMTEADGKLVKEHHPEAEVHGSPGCWLITIPGSVWDQCCEDGTASWCPAEGLVWYISETR
jgi:hypothetical protein